MRSASGLAWHRRALIRVMALTPVLLVAAVSGARGESHWRTETTEPLALKGNGCGITASDLTEVPPRGPIGNVYDLRVLNLHVGQKLTDSTTGQVTATVTSVELLHMSATGADLRVAAVGSDASCSDPKLLRSRMGSRPERARALPGDPFKHQLHGRVTSKGLRARNLRPGVPVRKAPGARVVPPLPSCDMPSTRL